MLSRLLKSIAVAMALVGMVLGTTAMQNGHLTLGLAMLALFILAYAAAENAFKRPRFWLVPGVWVLFSIAFGAGTKGEMLILGLLPLLLVMSWVRRKEAQVTAGKADGPEPAETPATEQAS